MILYECNYVIFCDCMCCFFKKRSVFISILVSIRPPLPNKRNENKLKTLDSPHDDVKVNLTSLSIRSPETRLLLYLNLTKTETFTKLSK
jgi:hypothetical protein